MFRCVTPQSRPPGTPSTLLQGGLRGNCCYCVRRAKPQSELPSLVERSDSSIFHTRQQCQANPTSLKVIHAPHLTTPILSHTLVTARRHPVPRPASARPSTSSLRDSRSSSHLCAHGLTSSASLSCPCAWQRAGSWDFGAKKTTKDP